MCCVCMSFIVGRWAANLPEDAGDSAELVAESPCQRAARAGLLPAVGQGLLLGAANAPVCSVCLQMDPNCPEHLQSDTHKGLPLETLCLAPSS